MKKVKKKDLEINLDTISEKILKEIGNSKDIRELKGDASEFLILFSMKLAQY